MPFCLAEGVGILAYFPLAGGVLTGKYKPGSPPPQGSRVLTQPVFAKHLTEQYPTTNTAQTVNIVSLHDDIAGPVRPAPRPALPRGRSSPREDRWSSC